MAAPATAKNDNYFKFIATELQGKECPISLEAPVTEKKLGEMDSKHNLEQLGEIIVAPPTENKQDEKNVEFVFKAFEYITRRNPDGSLQPYSVEQLIELEKKQGSRFNDPLTNEPFFELFYERFKAHKAAFQEILTKKTLTQEVKGLAQVIAEEEQATVEERFIRFLITPGIMLDHIPSLRILVTLDFAKHFFAHVVADNKLSYNDAATAYLRDLPGGSWCIRPTSVQDDKKSGRFLAAMTCKLPNQQIKHILIYHEAGSGFFLLSGILAGKNINEIEVDRQDARHRFPYLLDIIHEAQKKGNCKLSLYAKRK